MKLKKTVVLAAVLLPTILALTACGGGGGSAGECKGGAAICFPTQLPPVDLTPPPTGLGTPSAVPLNRLAGVCTPDGEKTWVRKFMDDTYLWYNEIVNQAPGAYSTPQSYFNALLVRPKDRFSFTANQRQIDQYFESGQSTDYGMSLTVDNGRLRVTMVQPGSPAALQGIGRGAQITAIDGVAIERMSSNDQVAALYPDTAGASHSFGILDNRATFARTVQMTSTAVTITPVPQASVLRTEGDGKKVGYLLFTDHIETAEQPLIDAMDRFQQAGIDELVLDLRYNGGGYLFIAGELASMIGGAALQGKTFEQLLYNDKLAHRTNASKFPFPSTSDSGRRLPQLNLKRVFVLTGPGTCSASESIINGLLPFVEVVRIGGTTCGKPFGFVQENNCGTAYFAIQFSGVNDAGKGDFTQGFTPTCGAADDLEHTLGSPDERLLKSAIAYSRTGTCPATSVSRPLQDGADKAGGVQDMLPPWRHSRLLKPQG